MRDGMVYSEIMHGYVSCSGSGREVRAITKVAIESVCFLSRSLVSVMCGGSIFSPGVILVCSLYCLLIFCRGKRWIRDP